MMQIDRDFANYLSQHYPDILKLIEKRNSLWQEIKELDFKIGSVLPSLHSEHKAKGNGRRSNK